jgi:hypothetical protein
MKLILIICLLTNKAMSNVFAQDWTGCIDPNYPDKQVTRGQSTAVCLTVGPSGNWTTGTTNVRYSFRPKADEYSRFVIPGSYAIFMNGAEYPELDGGITVHSSSQYALSFLRLYIDREQNFIFPHLTAIIDVKDGVVKGIAWDDACLFCSSNRCEENTYDFYGNQKKLDDPTKGCYFTKEQCDDMSATKNGNECDLTLYTVWTGTDKNGKKIDKFLTTLFCISAKTNSRSVSGCFE